MLILFKAKKIEGRSFAKCCCSQMWATGFCCKSWRLNCHKRREWHFHPFSCCSEIGQRSLWATPNKTHLKWVTVYLEGDIHLSICTHSGAVLLGNSKVAGSILAWLKTESVLVRNQSLYLKHSILMFVHMGIGKNFNYILLCLVTDPGNTGSCEF